jgi:dihydropteroate synthase
MIKRPIFKISWDSYTLELGIRTCLMGILNVTPDSFSDGGQFYTVEKAVTHGKKLVSDGADILDIGGESTRPFSSPVSADEEIRRVVPVIEQLASRIPVPISIDTTKASVAKRAIKAGAAMVNDIGSFRPDPKMAEVAAQYGVPVILMHMLGTPQTMQKAPEYADLISDIKRFLETVVLKAEKCGISRSKLILDPGIGFGKTVSHNLLILNQLNEFHTLGLPLLIGVSRKSVIQKTLYPPSETDQPCPSADVEIGTQAAVAAAIANGAHIIRIHDVATTRLTAKMMDAIVNVEPK